jgi:hypothetical protein
MAVREKDAGVKGTSAALGEEESGAMARLEEIVDF